MADFYGNPVTDELIQSEIQVLKEMGLSASEAQETLMNNLNISSVEAAEVVDDHYNRQNKMGGGMMIIGHNDVANSGIADILEKYRTIRSNL